MNGVGATTEVPTEGRLRGLLRRRPSSRAVSFPELVWVHYLRQQDLNDGRGRPYTGPAEERYREFEARFEERNGPIVSSYWCSTEASAVALTIKRRESGVFLIISTTLVI